MERSQPNEHGVFVDAEKLHISTHKSLKTRLEIRIACDPEGKFRAGYSYHLGFSIGAPGGGGGPSDKDVSFDTLETAVMSVVNYFRAMMRRFIDNNMIHINGAGEKILADINKFAKPYEETAPITSGRHFCHGADFTRYPLPDPNPLTLAADVRSAVCNVCPLATRGHILVPCDNHPSSYTKYCTLTAIAHGLIEIDTALSDGQSKPTTEDQTRIKALLSRLHQIKRYEEAEIIHATAASACLIQAETLSDTEPEQPLQVEKHRPSKTAYICGWMSAELPDRPSSQLYVYKYRNDWGVVSDPTEASHFKNVEAVLDWYRINGTVHGDPETNSYNGYLKIFENGPFGLRLVPQPTRQGGLFDNLPPLDIIEKQPDLIKTTETADCFTNDEKKLHTAGYILVKYNRELKTIQQTYIPPKKGWAPSVTFGTYAAAERTLKEALQAEKVVEVTLEGKVNMTTCSRKLFTAGFEFYRVYGFHAYDTSHCIKVGSKNWSNLAKYKDQVELRIAWDKLMNEDPKALEG